MILEITFPIIKAYSSENYALIIEDSGGKTHYWLPDGSYDGWSQETDISLN